ncbi:hypothetical protein PtA15_4A28 [Puccinia triticina]|uniref:Methyltransferase domain-containing protein n=1 Tax=Puccinia triticina TaxID=208348 RepID=A0ABY7CFQ2_9BASI|nr:uncharacterized protein PtA15_4A28 [Puccinia triticina]WAQ83580.1 hypothetical protein PtA15_4A28 [Puccinia triticina]WAR54412.1 hypothetical protein PtB15_4B29 [Puccinia triticina]
MLEPQKTHETSHIAMDQFGSGMSNMPASAVGIKAAYPLDDPRMKDQLEFYQAATGIRDPQELKAHLLDIRAEGCKTFPFPCVLCFHFLQGMIARHSFFPNVVNSIQEKSNTRKIFLDIGAGMGNDLRQLIHHGWNRDDVLGVDVNSEWSVLGYKLFRDNARPVPNFIGNILEPQVLDVSTPAEVGPDASINLYSLKDLNPLKGKVTFISLNQLFHFFDETDQKRLAERCVLLLSNTVGSTIFGMQVGGIKKGLQSCIKTFVHSPETWKEMWESVFGPNKVKVVSELVETTPEDHLVQLFPGCTSIQRLYWSVTRI